MLGRTVTGVGTIHGSETCKVRACGSAWNIELPLGEHHCFGCEPTLCAFFLCLNIILLLLVGWSVSPVIGFAVMLIVPKPIVFLHHRVGS